MNPNNTNGNLIQPNGMQTQQQQQAPPRHLPNTATPQYQNYN
jgi:hypothetical protein